MKMEMIPEMSLSKACFKFRHVTLYYSLTLYFIINNHESKHKPIELEHLFCLVYSVKCKSFILGTYRQT